MPKIQLNDPLKSCDAIESWKASQDETGMYAKQGGRAESNKVLNFLRQQALRKIRITNILGLLEHLSENATVILTSGFKKNIAHYGRNEIKIMLAFISYFKVLNHPISLLQYAQNSLYLSIFLIDCELKQASKRLAVSRVFSDNNFHIGLGSDTETEIISRLGEQHNKNIAELESISHKELSSLPPSPFSSTSENKLNPILAASLVDLCPHLVNLLAFITKLNQQIEQERGEPSLRLSNLLRLAKLPPNANKRSPARAGSNTTMSKAAPVDDQKEKFIREIKDALLKYKSRPSFNKSLGNEKTPDHITSINEIISGQGLCKQEMIKQINLILKDINRTHQEGIGFRLFKKTSPLHSLLSDVIENHSKQQEQKHTFRTA